jgi:hypothetical protein
VIKTNICSIDYKKSLTKVFEYHKEDKKAGIKIYKENIKDGAKEIINSNYK